MSRQARKISKTGFYHVMFRGINHQSLFEEDIDYEQLLSILKTLIKSMGIEIHAYCLMSNHVHLLIRELSAGDISLFMKRVLTKYAMYFNKKYERNGALIASRYKSVPVNVDGYFILLVRYIHQNPVKAGIVKKIQEYTFSSYREYLNGSDWINTNFSLSMVSKDEWKNLHKILGNEDFDISGKISQNEMQIRQKILEITNGREPLEIMSYPREERNQIIRRLKEIGLSIRQIERATGISRGVVAKC